MILSLLSFDLRPGSLATLEEVFRAHRIFERAIQTEGCRSLYLAADPADDRRAHVVGVWEDEAAYQRWLDDPGRENGSDDLHAIVADTWDPSAPGALWRVLHATAAGTIPRTDPSSTS